MRLSWSPATLTKSWRSLIASWCLPIIAWSPSWIRLEPTNTRSWNTARAEQRRTKQQMETSKADRLGQFRAVLSNQAVSMLLILILMWFLLSLLSPYFFTASNLWEITLQTAVIGIIAAGQTLVILSGGIDLSVGSVFACAGIAGGLVFQATGNLWLTLAATLLTGAALGSLNGLFISQLRVPPFIATLGMLGMARGLALILSRGIPIFGLSREYLWIGQGKLFDLVPDRKSTRLNSS